MRPTSLLRLEGLIVLAAAALAYHAVGLSWWWFAALFLAPDLSFLGYVAGPRVGAIIYNIAHTHVLALGLVLTAWLAGWQLGIALGLTWVAHIGFDRALGYGLKLAEDFHETHLGRIGRNRPDRAP